MHHYGYTEFQADDPKQDGMNDMLGDLMGMMDMFNSHPPPVISSGYDDRYVRYDQQRADQELEDQQAVVCPSAIIVYSLRSRQWHQITIAGLGQIEWKKSALTELVLEPTQKNLIQALVSQHKDKRGNFVADFIDGKGQVSSLLFPMCLCVR